VDLSLGPITQIRIHAVKGHLHESVTQPLTTLWQQFFWDTDRLLMADYLHPGKTTTGQYYTELTFKLLDVIKHKQ